MEKSGGALKYVFVSQGDADFFDFETVGIWGGINLDASGNVYAAGKIPLVAMFQEWIFSRAQDSLVPLTWLINVTGFTLDANGYLTRRTVRCTRLGGGGADEATLELNVIAWIGSAAHGAGA